MEEEAARRIYRTFVSRKVLTLLGNNCFDLDRLQNIRETFPRREK